MGSPAPHVLGSDGSTVATSPYLEEVREKLWRALHVTHNQRAGLVEEVDHADDDVNNNTISNNSKSQGGQQVDRMSSDVHTSPTTPAAQLELTHADMEQLIGCVYCAIHTNATPDDAQAAADSVLAQLGEGGVPPHDEATSTAAPYTAADVIAFLNSVPSRWLPDLVTAQEEAAQLSGGNSVWEDFNVELIECIVNDDAPHNLLPPAEVLTLQRTTAAIELEAPFTDYFALPPTRAYPPVYDYLFSQLCCLDDRTVTGLSQSQFRIFFHWFYAMHFRNTNLPRSNAAADHLYRRYQDAQGNVTVPQFALACEEVCAVYAQRRDAAAYLQLLVQRTESVLTRNPAANAAPATDRADAADFFLHPEDVTLPAWQRDLIDPTQLYLPDELRVAQQESERHRRHTSPRILLMGPVGIGKSAVGHELAETLHCVHLDVLELAVAALQPGSRSAVRETVKACLRDQTPLPLPAQVTLLREAMLSQRVQYRGYVFSDTITSTGAEAMEAIEEHYLRPLNLVAEARPDHVVELVCAVPDVYAEYAATRAATAAAASGAAWDAVLADAEKRRRAAEKKQMRADCEKLLAHLVELESAGPKKEAAAVAELETARQQAIEAQEILDALNAEEEEEAANAAATAASAVNEDALDDAEDASPEAKAARENAELQLRLSALIYKGRQAAGVTIADAEARDGVAPLADQDWTGCWRKSVEASKSIGRHLSVDPIASADSAQVVAYITHALDLHPCDLAEALEVPGDEAAAAGAAGLDSGSVTRSTSAGAGAAGDNDSTHARPSSLAEDEERCRVMEEILAERGLSTSPVWKRFCPVTAAVDGVLIEGAACYACVYRGCCYYFASRKKRDAFVDFPTRYLAHAFPEQKAVLLLADDALVEAMPAVLQQIAGDVAVQCRLTAFPATAYATMLEPRQALLHARATAQESRRKAEAAARKARHERQELAAKAQSKKPKGKLEPSKPKAKRLSDSAGRNPSIPTNQQSSQPPQPQPPHKGSEGGRRRVPRAMVVEGPQSVADEKQLLIDAAKERKAASAPLLVTVLTPADLDVNLIQKLAAQQLVPETVVALRYTDSGSGAAGLAGESADDGEGATEAEEEVEENDNDNTEVGGGAHKRSGNQGGAAPLFDRILRIFENAAKGDWRTARAEAGSGGGGDGGNSTNNGGGRAPSSHEIHSVPVSETAAVAEVVADVLHQLNPLAIAATEDAVDEALGEAEEDGEGGGGGEDEDDDEEAAAEDEALLYPEGSPRPPALPRAPRDPLAKPMRRFLHQFGSRLDYCPVTLHDRGILVRGKQEFCLRYIDGLYIFASEEARDAFARCPQRYVGELPPQDVPPRVWVVGVTQSGKKTMAAGLQEAYRVPYFVYDRQFFEECVEAALTPGGGMVRGVYIPADTKESNPYLKRAFTLLESVHDREKEEKKKLAEKAEAERLLEEHERRLEEREAREDAGSEDDADGADDDEDWTEEKEAALQAQLEFEPEDEEEKQVRLSESYLRIASCVTRFRPFDKLGYVMICPPFSDGDLDVLFDEGGIPEVVVRLNVDEEVFNQRSALRAAARRAAQARARLLDVAAQERAALRQATQQTREALRQQRAREKALAKWRRRHIGANDIEVPSDPEEEEEDSANAAEAADGTQGADRDGEEVNRNGAAGSGSGAAAGAEAEDEVEAEADRQAQEDALEEFMTFVEERRVEVVKINAAAAQETVRRAVVEALGRHLAHRASLFYHPEVLRPAEAAAQLANGQCDWSSFGEQDPVRLYAYRREGQRTACRWKPAGVRVGPEEEDEAEDVAAHLTDNADANGDDGQPADEPEELSEVDSDEVDELRNAVERRNRRARREAARRVARVHHRLYSFDSDATLVRFMRNPWPFMQEPPPHPALPQAAVVAVFEPDTRYAQEVEGRKQCCLADALAFNLHAKCLSTSSLLAWAAVHRHWQALRLDCMLAAQQSAVDVALTQKLLTLYLSSAEAKRNGAVLHNVPITPASADALARVNGAAPVVKVMSALTETAAASAPSSATKATEAALEVVRSMRAYASVEFTLPHPAVPLDSSNLVAAVHGVEAFCVAAQEGRLREARAFPVPLRDAYEVYRHVQRHLSEFGAFCPYEWVEKGDLVQCFPRDVTATSTSSSSSTSAQASPAVDLSFAAKYLGQYFFFSSADYLERFLRNPTTVTDSATAKPMPKHLPTPIAAAVVAAQKLQEADFALEGCCPVLLYDTRDRRGLRGVRQPIAKKGSLDFVVEYEGQRYAMLNAEHQRRFLRRPWQYVEGAQLPAVLRRPLPKGVAPSAIADTEEYLQRQLYDPVAQALLAVSQERPIYPGLTPEESALKYVALYMKAHRDPATISAFEAESYRASFELFQKRATLYRRLTPHAGNDAASRRLTDDEERSKSFCATYEELQADADQMNQLNRLPDPSDRPWS